MSIAKLFENKISGAISNWQDLSPGDPLKVIFESLYICLDDLQSNQDMMMDRVLMILPLSLGITAIKPEALRIKLKEEFRQFKDQECFTLNSFVYKSINWDSFEANLYKSEDYNIGFLRGECWEFHSIDQIYKFTGRSIFLNYPDGSRKKIIEGQDFERYGSVLIFKDASSLMRSYNGGVRIVAEDALVYVATPPAGFEIISDYRNGETLEELQLRFRSLFHQFKNGMSDSLLDRRARYETVFEKQVSESVVNGDTADLFDHEVEIIGGDQEFVNYFSNKFGGLKITEPILVHKYLKSGIKFRSLKTGEFFSSINRKSNEYLKFGATS